MIGVINSHGFGDVAPVSLPSTGVLAPPSIGIVDINKMADFTNGGAWSAGDSYEVSVMNAAANVPVSLNGTVVGTTSNPDGLFTYKGTVQAGQGNQTWSVPGGPSGYPSLGIIPPVSKVFSFGQSAGGGAVAPCFTPFGASDTSPCVGPVSQATLIVGGIALALLFFMGRR